MPPGAARRLREPLAPLTLPEPARRRRSFSAPKAAPQSSWRVPHMVALTAAKASTEPISSAWSSAERIRNITP